MFALNYSIAKNIWLQERTNGCKTGSTGQQASSLYLLSTPLINEVCSYAKKSNVL